MRVDEPEPGRVLTESDTGSSLVTTWTVTPEGHGSRVRVETRWQGAGGVGGVFERLFAPRVLRGIYSDELGRLDRYARTTPPRSEEHTSELQSQFHLVCRLLLEKKNKN